MDVLGIGTFQQGIQVLANGLDVTGFSTFKTGVVVTGVATATSFVGNVAGDATGLVEVPMATVANIDSVIITAFKWPVVSHLEHLKIMQMFRRCCYLRGNSRK